VRLPALGAITPRSVTGVKAPVGSPIELLAGVVKGFAVVRSVLGEAVDVRETAPERLQDVGAGHARAGGEGDKEQQQQ